MGDTVEPFRVDLEEEINRWSGFARALRKPDREAFDELMNIYRTCASECSFATKRMEFELLAMSILLFQQKRLVELEKQLETISPAPASPSAKQEPTTPHEAEPVLSTKFVKKEGG